MSDTVDDALLAVLRATGHAIYDGEVDTDETEKVIRVELPYIVFYSGLGEDIDVRAGRPGGVVTTFQTTYVGESREQARALGQVARDALSARRVSVGGRESGLIRAVDSSQVRRGDTYTRPGGAPLFYGVTKYEVGSF